MRTIISRQGWEARPPKKPFTQLKKWRVQGIVVHHSGVKEAPKGIAALKAFERFHMDSRGWNAIAYNWLVDPEGVIYAGRGAGIVSGATKGWNSRTESICYTGGGFVEIPQAARDSIRWLVGDIQGRYDDKLWVKGHRDLGNSTCPGNWLYDWVTSGMPMPLGDPNKIEWDGIKAHVDRLREKVSHSPLSTTKRSRGEAVRAAQERLSDLGFTPGPVDGIYGRKSAKAVKDFQKSFEAFLKPDGVVGLQTWDALFGGWATAAFI